MSMTAPLGPPRACIRRSLMTTAAITPAMMQSAYARSGNGPRCHTDWLGLGIEARVTRTRYRYGLSALPDPGREIGRQHADRLHAAGQVGCVQQAPDQCRPDDH